MYFFILKNCFDFSESNVYRHVNNIIKWPEVCLNGNIHLGTHAQTTLNWGKIRHIEGKEMSKTWNIYEDISTRVRKIINERRILNLYFGWLVPIIPHYFIYIRYIIYIVC